MLSKCNSIRNKIFPSWILRYSFSTITNAPTYVVIGGVAGGATASTRMRRNCDKCNIIMFERGKYVSFANCGLPYYVGNIIKDEKKLIVTGPELFKKRFNIDVRTESNVININRLKKEITIETKDKTYIQKYDKLLLAVGASPITPSTVSGLNLNGVFSIRSIEDSRWVRTHLDKLPKNRNDAVIVGGGFIGLEMAENMVHRGYNCTIIDGLPQVMGPIDHEMTTPFNRVLTENGVKLILNETLKSISASDESDIPKLNVLTENGLLTETDIVILGLGVLPENKLAIDCGLNIGIRGSVIVDNTMKTNDENIYCVGDVVETFNYITKKPQNLALAGPAQQQARIAADNITKIRDIDYKFRGVQSSSVCHIFDETLASTGLSMKMIENKTDNNICTIYAHPGHHADFYPNAKPLHLKLIFNKINGEILGAQCCGTEGVVKIIDCIAVFIQMKGTIYDLAHCELCYSPQHGSARGAVNIVGQLGMNICENLIDLADWNDIINESENISYILDVRNENECKNNPLQGSNNNNIKVINIPMDELRERINELNEFKTNGITLNTMCAVGKRGYAAARFLKQNGINAKLCSGGMTTYYMIKHSYAYHK
eukprot:339734_1